MNGLEQRAIIDCGITDAGTPQRWRVLIATFLTYFYDSYCMLAISIAMPVILGVLDISKSQGGMLNSALMVGAMAGSLFMGMIAENKGRKFTLVLCLTWFGIALIPIIFIHNFVFWLIILAFAGIGLGGVFGPCIALVTQHWNGPGRSRANALMLSTFALGGIIVALMGRFVLGQDWRILFAVGSTSIINAIIVFVLIPSDKVKRIDIGTDKKIGVSDLFKPGIKKRTIAATSLGMCTMAGFWGVSGWVPTYLRDVRSLTTEEMAYFTLVIYIGMFIGYQVWSVVANQIGRKKTIVICLVCDAVSIVLYLLLPNSIILWWGAVVGFSFGGALGVMGGFFGELFPKDIKAMASGFCFNIGRIGSVIAPLFLGFIGEKFGLQPALAIGPVFFLFGIVAITFLPETQPTE